MVKIYRFRVYDTSIDEMKLSRRWGTRKGIERINGLPIEDSARETTEDNVGEGPGGLTDRDFDPDASNGFQRQVR